VALVEISELSVEYPRSGQAPLRVLDKLSLEVQAGQFVSLIGPSGCGKTTLVNVVAGLCKPRTGTVTVHGSLAVAFQESTLMPWLDVEANTLFALECRGSIGDAERKRTVEVLTTMGLGDHLAALPHELSEGMKQRVNLARALITDPDLLVLDEPFSALDALTRRQLHDDLLERCKSAGIATLMVSHSLDEVAYLSDRVGVLGGAPTCIREFVEVELEHPRKASSDSRHKLVDIAESLAERMTTTRADRRP